MAITIDDFSKIWASTSPLTPYEFSENNYKSGWNFIGSTPPSRQMWDFLQKQNDEKFKYIADNFVMAQSTSVPTTDITFNVAPYSFVAMVCGNIFSLLQYVSDGSAHSLGSLLFTLPDKYRPARDCRIPFTSQDNTVTGYIKIISATGECTVDAISNTSTVARLCIGGCMWFTV